MRTISPAQKIVHEEDAMNTHPYLRAYMAGAFLPTLMLPLLLTVFIVVRLVLQWPVPIERGMIFPMAMVPSLFGVWNMVWEGLHTRTHHPIGLHGAVLPLLMAPVGGLIACYLGLLQFEPNGVFWFQAVHFPYALVPVGCLAAMAGYYLVWKYLIGYLNRVLGIA
jgi:hypothetical protein